PSTSKKGRHGFTRQEILRLAARPGALRCGRALGCAGPTERERPNRVPAARGAEKARGEGDRGRGEVTLRPDIEQPVHHFVLDAEDEEIGLEVAAGLE